MKRGRGKYIVSHGIQQHYEYYEEISDEPVDRKLHKEVLNDMCKLVLEKILLKGEDLKMIGLGYIYIRKRKPKITVDKDGNIRKNKVRIDYHKTKLLWKKKYPGETIEEIIQNHPDRPKVYHMNDHSGGFGMKIYHDVRNLKLKNNRLFAFLPSRTFKRDLSKKIKNFEIKIAEN